MNLNRVSIVAAGAVLLLAGAALGQGVLTGDQLTNYANTFWYDLGGGQHGTYDGNFTTNGMDLDDTRKSSWSEDGYAGSAFSHNSTTYGPSNPGINGAFNQVFANMESFAEITASNLKSHSKEEAQGEPYDYVYFTLAQAADWTFTGDVAGSSTAGYDNYGRYNFGIYDLVNNNYAAADYRYATNGGSFGESISINGQLPAGNYILILDALSIVHNENGLGGVGSASASISKGVFTLSDVPTPGAAALLGVGGLVAARRWRY